MFTKRRAGVVVPEQAALTQDRYDLLGEAIEAAGQPRRHDVEAVRGAVVEPDLDTRQSAGRQSTSATRAGEALHDAGSDEDYGSYREGNNFMARAAFDLRDRDAFWVHDYHLLPLGADLLKLGIERPTGFFLQTTSPPSPRSRETSAKTKIGCATSTTKWRSRDGAIWALGLGEDDVQAFTDFGIERLIELIQIYKEDPELLKRWSAE